MCRWSRNPDPFIPFLLIVVSPGAPVEPSCAILSVIPQPVGQFPQAACRRTVHNAENAGRPPADTNVLPEVQEQRMTLKHYFPLSVAVFVLVVALARHFSVPVLPFAAVLLTGETLLGFQAEDHKVGRSLKALFTPAKSHRK